MEINKNEKITIGVPTRNRYKNLALCLQGLINQAYKNWDLIIVDDSDNPRDLRFLSIFQNLFIRLDREKHNWQIIYGQRRGPHYSQQIILEIAKTDWIWRIDDDEIAENDCLTSLVNNIDNNHYLLSSCIKNEIINTEENNIGAIGGKVIQPRYLDIRLENPDFTINSLFDFNGQWDISLQKKITNVEHLHSTFLYNRQAVLKVGGYDLGFSPVGHLEETDLTYRLFQAGYNNIFEPKALTWHYRAERGGIRDNNQQFYFEHDEKIFFKKYRKFNSDKIYVPIFGGIGDHLLATPMLRGLKKKYPDKNLIVGASNPIILRNLLYIDGFCKTEMAEKISGKPSSIYEIGFKQHSTKHIIQLYCDQWNVENDGKKLDFIFSGNSQEV